LQAKGGLMKKLILTILSVVFLFSQCFAANEWRKGTGENVILGTEQGADVDTISYQNIVAPLDRLLTNYRQGPRLTYASASTLTVTSGEVTCSNGAATIRRFRSNTSTITTSWTVGTNGLDAGAKANSTTYYVYAIGDADATTFTVVISTNSTTPGGTLHDYYKRLGSFYTDSSGNITNITNDNSLLSYYDSGWFAVTINTSYAKTHNLGTTKVIFMVYVAENSDGSGWCFPLNKLYASPAATSAGTFISALSATSVTVQTGTNAVTLSTDNQTAYTSGYARIIMLAIE
jgi:hypothetical protein